MTLIHWVLLYGRYLVNIWGALCLRVFVICSVLFCLILLLLLFDFYN